MGAGSAMTSDAGAPGRSGAHGVAGALERLAASADFARTFTLTVFATLVGTHLIVAVAGIVTLRTIIAGLCVVAIGILVARREEISFLRLVPTTLLMFTTWAFASVFWSNDAFSSFWRWTAMAAVALLAVTIGHVRDTLQTVRALGDVLRAALTLSLVLEVLSGIIFDTPLRFLGIQGNIASFGPIQGIFGTRNMLGFFAVVALITFAVEMRTHSVRPGVAVFSLSLGAALGVLSASPTVLVLAVVVGAATAVLTLVRAVPAARRTRVQWIVAGVVAVASVALYLQRARIVDLLGARDDLAMRSNLWAVARYFSARRPVQGWGWFGSWDVAEQPFASINHLLSQRHTTALNAYVDVHLQLGWVGVLLVCAFGGLALVRSWLDASQRRSVVYAWTPLMVIALAVTSVFESVALFGLGWMLLVLCAVRAGQSRGWRERLGAGGPPATGTVQTLPPG
ncbi:O-antigen ligase family protein [uncultured Microbacterium sp.]|uniref:O-antigen ligase family protein n=1 Tax=uncultured Microbacterium sp. TaxID=191216 RepID=UPI00259690BF|nr:O-antigen ligase family protein [uncultured Microbacterium sp.]